MTLDELNLIKTSLREYSRAAECNNPNCQIPSCKALKIINREINLKIMDPRKSRDDDS